MAEETSTPSKIVVPHSTKWHGRLAANLTTALSLGIAATLRYRLDDPSGFATGKSHGNVIFVVWHNRLALSLPIYDRFLKPRHSGCRLAAMVSASKDGGLLARVLENFQVQPVRGSTSRRGPQALLELTRWAERGYDVAITPDGPRGPAYVVQDGVVSLAQLTGIPIVPIGINLSSKISLQSWDRFQIPIPFGACSVMVGQPVSVDGDASTEERSALKGEIQMQMLAATKD